jgi:hypothetical protein
MVGRDRVVGVATRHDWTIRGSNPSRGEMRQTRTDRPSGTPNLSTMSTWSFPGVKRTKRGAMHPPPNNAAVKERVKISFYSPTVLSGQVAG